MRRSAQTVPHYFSSESKKEQSKSSHPRWLNQYTTGTESCRHSLEISSNHWTWEQHYRTEKDQSSQNRWSSQQRRCHKGASRWRSSLPWLFRKRRGRANHFIPSITAKHACISYRGERGVKTKPWTRSFNFQRRQENIQLILPASCRAILPCRSTFPTGQLCCKITKKNKTYNNYECGLMYVWVMVW